MTAMVEFRGVRKEYGKKTAVLGLDLTIQKGELFVLLGPNGAGKTTTLKMLVGLLRLTSGSISVGGFDIAKDPDKAKNLISFVPDVPYVYEKLTPRELLRFTGQLRSLGRRQIEEQGDELLRFFSLDHVRDVLLEEFSHGMRQKAILASALLHKPELLILDEPMVGLDPMSIKSFKDFLKKKCAEGMTIVFSTHTLPLAQELADRIAILNKGELAGLGTLEDLQKKFGTRENLEAMFLRLVEKEEAPGAARQKLASS